MVLNVSADLPFAQGRFCGAEGLRTVTTASTFRGDFGHVWRRDRPTASSPASLARAVVVLDVDGNGVAPS